MRPGDRILLDDGMLDACGVLGVGASGAKSPVPVLNEGVLKDRKGMNLPRAYPCPPRPLTAKDREDARFALGPSAWTTSPCRSSAARRTYSACKLLIAEAGKTTPVIAKVEKPEAIDCIEEILKVADGLMVARGDLGVELAPESVPIVQQELVTQARLEGKPVIVATQMLESMIEHPRPTRAEVVGRSSHAGLRRGRRGDAVLAGDGVGGLPGQGGRDDGPRGSASGGLAVGRRGVSLDHGGPGLRTVAALTLADRRGPVRWPSSRARNLQVRAVVVWTKEGTSASVVSATRPAAPVVALTMDASTWPGV